MMRKRSRAACGGCWRAWDLLRAKQGSEGVSTGEGRGCASLCFFFQAEDGIRDLTVTGVQTCALPISAYVGLLDIGQPKPGETVVVSAAAGAVGSVVGQLAKIRGCRAVGVAGSEAKCELVVKELGFDACVNYRTEPLLSALQKACPKGIDVYFDNVGGDVLAAVLRLINRFARIPLCGLISQYNATELPPGPNLSPILVNRALIRGFIISDHGDRFADFHRDCAQWLREGRIRYREDVVVGLENAPEAFIGLLRGRNVGKLVVKVGDDPTVKSC